ncbi:DUF6189 family protein [Phytomonospora sp. NPDC050363]|uniref:DUF6189 family protein n=1 Tax=Phytomonospora sp. NPDC050363 TaxID=3155642 RepID=UPI0033EA2AE9
MNPETAPSGAAPLIDRLVTEVDARHAESIRANAAAGDWRAALTELTARLVDDGTPIARHERAALHGALYAAGLPGDIVRALVVKPFTPEQLADMRETATGTRSVVERLAPRIGEHEADYLRGAAIAGEWRLAVTDLIGYLARDEIPVSAVDRDDLRKLLTRFGEPHDELDRLIVDGVDEA